METDFQAVADRIEAMTCIVSVEKLDNGGYGEIRIVTGNKAYIDSIENPQGGVNMLTDKFVPNKEYTCYLPKDLNFEDFCYRSAVEKKCLHSYAHPDRFPVWFNMTFMPLGPDNGNICYCSYTMEINYEPDSTRMSQLSGDIAASVLKTCIMLRGATDFKKTMNDVVDSIRKLCKAYRCCIMTMHHFERKCEVMGLSCEDGQDKDDFSKYMGEDSYELMSTWDSAIAGSNCLIVKNEQDMDVVRERNPVWAKSLELVGTKTLVIFPLKDRDGLLGYMWVMNFDPEDAPMIKETLESTAFILGSEISNYQLLDKLKVLSSRDMLTGVLNRNEMNNVVESFANGTALRKKNVGIMFADLNGLKVINDKDGHEAGDKLLKDAAMALSEVFDVHQIFRAGGDEFIVITSGMTQEELNEKIKEVRDVCQKYENVSLAIGSSVVEDITDIRKALRAADEMMYEDKKKYYELHSEKKRTTVKDRLNMD